jgi:5'(3')-deoxyribonucleotidase
MKIVYFDMDGVLADFAAGLAAVRPEVRERYAGEEDNIPHLFSDLPPIDGGIEAFHKLSEVYDVYILSTAPWGNVSAWSDKAAWVRRHLGEAAKKRLILSHTKHLNIGDYLIDDRTANGAGKFTGMHIHFGTERFPDWDSVVSYLLGEAK